MIDVRGGYDFREACVTPSRLVYTFRKTLYFFNRSGYHVALSVPGPSHLASRESVVVLNRALQNRAPPCILHERHFNFESEKPIIIESPSSNLRISSEQALLPFSLNTTSSAATNQPKSRP